MVNAQQAAANWKKGLSGSAQKMLDGVNAVQTNPMELAANRVDAYIAGVTNNVQKWQDGLRSTTLQGWKDSMKNKTAPRIAQGAATGESKMQNFMTQFLPQLQATVSNLPPRGDLETNIQRANTVMRANANFKYNKRG